MTRRSSVGGAFEEPQHVKAGDIPTTTFGTTGIKVSVIAQGGARMDLHPDVRAAAAHVRRVYDLGVTYFDCARSYWGGRSEEAYGIGLQGIRLLVSGPHPSSRPALSEPYFAPGRTISSSGPTCVPHVLAERDLQALRARYRQRGTVPSVTGRESALQEPQDWGTQSRQ